MMMLKLRDRARAALRIDATRARPASRRTTASVAAIVIAATSVAFGPTSAGASDGWSDVIEDAHDIRDIAYPLADDAGYYVDTWLYPRGSRRHLGVDLMADKLVPILAANAGCVTYLSYGGPGGGNMLTLTDDEGWQYRYIHINNDSPGTDDGANPYEWAFVDGLAEGDCVERGQHISYVGDSGNAEHTGAHLHFELRRPDGNWINPFPSVEAAREVARGGAPLPDPVDPRICSDRTAPAGAPDPDTASGFWMLDDLGVVHTHGATHHGDLSDIEDAAPAVSMEPTPSGEGYWILSEDGAVHPFGDAVAHGDMRGWDLNGPVRRIETTADGAGYWLVADDGGVFAFGNAGFHGSTGAVQLSDRVISMTATAGNDGYWLVAGDGGVFAFGEAAFHGSTGAMTLDQPVIDMAVPPSGDGYWLYASDGGVFSFGVEFHGSMPGLGLCDLGTSVAMRVSPTGGGYWIGTAAGEVYSFGDAAVFDGHVHPSEGSIIVDLAIAPAT